MWKVQKSPSGKVFETVLIERMELGPFFSHKHEAQAWCDTKNAKMVQDAAPDLLAALQAIVDGYQRHFEVMPVAWQTLDNIARAAIAKATGGAA